MTEKTIKPAQPDSTNREAFDRDARIHRTPVSKVEQEKRQDARAKPVLETHLAPGGTVEQVVRQEVDAENERRINFIKNRLARVKGKAKDRFRMAR